jgi:[glutamine synthetase] adenylyltransferase / [glutamine synthetase]-adenylyl-L-tyrosine phosphorylase
MLMLLNKGGVTKYQEYLLHFATVPKRKKMEFFKDYDCYFSDDQKKEQAEKIEILSNKDPIHLLMQTNSDDSVALTIVSYDYDSIFLIITGILAGLGFEIASGRVFTSKRKVTKVYRRNLFKKKLSKDVGLPIIVDHFTGTVTAVVSIRKWFFDLKYEITKAISYIAQNKTSSVDQAKQVVSRLISERLWRLKIEKPPVLHPISLDIDNKQKDFTRIKIISQDTPFFLYSLASALDQNNLYIAYINISKEQDKAIDSFFVVNRARKKIECEDELKLLRFSVLFTKQLTYFLDCAPDPYLAISRFGIFVNQILKMPKSWQWLELLSVHKNLERIARILGSSDFLWEDFIKISYESFQAIFDPVKKNEAVFCEENIESSLINELKNIVDFDEKKEVINNFKNKIIFLLDLSYILGTIEQEVFSSKLTFLAELIIAKSTAIILEQLELDYGMPKSVAGMEATFALFALGKFGSAELGYASDIELILVYSDSGASDGQKSILNSEFYAKLLQQLYVFIEAKQDGLFQIDLRLRPYGNDGPLPVSLESFTSYYGQGGMAHFYEKLSLVRLRYFFGSKELGKRVFRLRDTLLYQTQGLDLLDLWQLRQKQLSEKAASNLLNAKYSYGALVDLEYSVQTLQVVFGREHKNLRTPYTIQAITRLFEAEIVNADENKMLLKATSFFHGLVNGLRILRGSAKDLFLPEFESEEYFHLARRIGYVEKKSLKPSQQLHVDFATHTAFVRKFLENHFKDNKLDLPRKANIADIILSDSFSKGERNRVLARYGFKDFQKAYLNISCMKRLFSKENLFLFARFIVLACDWLSKKPDQDRVLNNLERFFDSETTKDPQKMCELLLMQPARLEVLLDVFSVSQFLTEVIIRNTNYFLSVTDQTYLYGKTNFVKLFKNLEVSRKNLKNQRDWLVYLRLLRQREFLRITIRDISLQLPLKDIFKDISGLAVIFLQSVLERVWDSYKAYSDDKNILRALKLNFCILAFGKLGGGELNYSSDIDLLAVYDENVFGMTGLSVNEVENIYDDIVKKIVKELSYYIQDGFVYRVDLSLRPYGKSGKLVNSLENMKNYYFSKASPWEMQALLKLFPVAGNWYLGYELVHQLRNYMVNLNDYSKILQSIKTNRKKSIIKYEIKKISGIDIKNCSGGIREIEFAIQGLQIKNLNKFPELWERNTLMAIKKLRILKIISDHNAEIFRRYYSLFRRLEHFLQLMEDRQTHILPKDELEVDSLAKRLFGNEATAEDLYKRLEKGFSEIQKLISI